jgi:hypothetical protein
MKTPTLMPAHIAAVVDCANNEIVPILHPGNAIRIRASATDVDLGRGLIIKRFVRPFVIELLAECIEPSLLASERRSWWSDGRPSLDQKTSVLSGGLGGGGFQAAVHTGLGAALRRFCGFRDLDSHVRRLGSGRYSQRKGRGPFVRAAIVHSCAKLFHRDRGGSAHGAKAF